MADLLIAWWGWLFLALLSPMVIFFYHLLIGILRSTSQAGSKILSGISEMISGHTSTTSLGGVKIVCTWDAVGELLACQDFRDRARLVPTSTHTHTIKKTTSPAVSGREQQRLNYVMEKPSQLLGIWSSVLCPPQLTPTWVTRPANFTWWACRNTNSG